VSVIARFLYPVIRPLMRVIYYTTERRVRQLPQPTDSPHIQLPGNNPDRVLLFGSGPAMGYGVLTNELALPGHLARQLAAKTKRAVDLDVVASAEVTIHDSVQRLRAQNLWRYDAIVLTIGINDALVLTPTRNWRTGLTAVLDHVVDNAPNRTSLFVVAIPPIHTFDSLSRLSGRLTARAVEALNRETQRVIQSYPTVSYIPFAESASADDVRYRSADTYRQWAGIIVEPLSAHLAIEPRDDAGPSDSEQH
jgi:lysophospholipase L1-like esterase